MVRIGWFDDSVWHLSPVVYCSLNNEMLHNTVNQNCLITLLFADVEIIVANYEYDILHIMCLEN